MTNNRMVAGRLMQFDPKLPVTVQDNLGRCSRRKGTDR